MHNSLSIENSCIEFSHSTIIVFQNWATLAFQSIHWTSTMVDVFLSSVRPRRHLLQTADYATSKNLAAGDFIVILRFVKWPLLFFPLRLHLTANTRETQARLCLSGLAWKTQGFYCTVWYFYSDEFAFDVRVTMDLLHTM
jgi:hypothetical protein